MQGSAAIWFDAFTGWRSSLCVAVSCIGHKERPATSADASARVNANMTFDTTSEEAFWNSFNRCSGVAATLPRLLFFPSVPYHLMNVRVHQWVRGCRKVLRVE